MRRFQGLLGLSWRCDGKLPAAIRQNAQSLRVNNLHIRTSMMNEIVDGLQHRRKMQQSDYRLIDAILMAG
jgi:hypothetical protein